MTVPNSIDNPKILLVDDDPAIREPCASCLQKAGFTVAVAENGRDAQAFFCEDPAAIQLLITDIHMPFVTGDELARFARSCGSSCRVLLISGGPFSIETTEENWQFLAKPFKPSVLVETALRMLSPAVQRPKALIAEDDDDMRDRLCRLLSRHYDVVAALDRGGSVVERAEELHPDIIILDIRMPDMSGLAVTRALQENHSRIPVVLVTQHSEPAYVDAAFASGASGYVIKLSIYKELIDALDKVRAGGRYLSADLRKLRPLPAA